MGQEGAVQGGHESTVLGGGQESMVQGDLGGWGLKRVKHWVDRRV